MMSATAMYDQPVSFADILTHDDDDDQQQQHAHAHAQNHVQAVNGAEPQLDDQELQTFFVRALYDYQSADASSLSFRRGDLIEVLTQLESGWWDGLLGEERGWFPSNYVHILTDEEAEAELAAREAEAAAALAAASPPSAPTLNGPAPAQNWQDAAEPVANGPPAARADDFWIPSVTSSGQVSLTSHARTPSHIQQLTPILLSFAGLFREHTYRRASR